MNLQEILNKSDEPNEPDPELDELSKKVIGACIAVHSRFGPGLTEKIYESSLCIELNLQKIPFVRQPSFVIEYNNQHVGDFQVDLIVDHRLVVELKAVDQLIDLHKAQLLTYLKITQCRLGLLINFNVPLLHKGIKRIINPYLR